MDEKTPVQQPAMPQETQPTPEPALASAAPVSSTPVTPSSVLTPETAVHVSEPVASTVPAPKPEMPKPEPIVTPKIAATEELPTATKGTPPPPMNTVLPSTTNDSPKGPKSGSKVLFVVAGIVIALLVGLAGGFLARQYAVKGTTTTQGTPATVASTISLPKDAVVIQRCADKKGTLYVKPADIPVGPVYMVYNNKVIGIEFMLSKEDFLSGKNWGDLNGLGAKVDHINIGFLSQGHEGYPIPHYHVDMYLVDKAVEDSIKCSVPGSAAPVATGSASATSSATATSSAVKSATTSATAH